MPDNPSTNTCFTSHQQLGYMEYDLCLKSQPKEYKEGCVVGINS